MLYCLVGGEGLVVHSCSPNITCTLIFYYRRSWWALFVLCGHHTAACVICALWGSACTVNSDVNMYTVYIATWQFPVLTAGVAAILVQFPIDHFRSIGWYNVILGVLYILLQLAVFRGESRCHCENVRQKYGCTLPEISNWKRTVTVSNLVVILISLKH